MPSTRLDATLLLCASLVAPLSALAQQPESGARWRPPGDPYWEGAAWTARAQDLRQRGSAEAMHALEEALRCWRAAGATREQADALATIGTLLNQAGQSRQALARLEEALALAREASAPGLEARALNGLGESRALLGELQDAFDAFTRLLALQRRLGDTHGEIEALGNLGYVYLGLGDEVEAADLFSRALAAARRSGARAFEATLLNNLGLALLEHGDLDGARTHYEAALALRPEGDPGRAYAMVNLGGAHRARGDARQAATLFEAALASFRSTGNRPAEATTLDNLGWAHAALGDHDRAYELHMQALDLREAIGDDAQHVPSLHFAARAELHRGRPAHARRLSERALALVEARREGVLSKSLRTSLLARTRVVYEGYVDALMELHRREPGAGLDRLAFDVSERARARSLVEQLADRGPGAGGPPARWAQPLTLAELGRRGLDRETVVIAYLLGEDRSHVWAWSGEALTAYELPPRERLAALASRCHDLLAARPGKRPRRATGDLQGLLAELSQLLLAPVASQLGSRRIAIVSDGPLHYVPFAALPAPGRPDVPLLVEHEVVTLPSVSTLSLLRETADGQAPASRGVAVFADPVFDAHDERVRPRALPRAQPPVSEPARLPRPSPLTSSVRDVDGRPEARLGRLPFTRREALDILALAGPQGSRRALDFDACLEAARAPDLADFRLVHFATHGLLNNTRPELSGLVLSLTGPDGQSREGFLSVEEILSLRWRAELVTLSGCRTGLGRSVNGEGLVGLTRAFMVAGVPRVVASLWSVDDSATAELMRRFYAEMLGPAKRSPAAALRIAQLELRKKRSRAAPYYWAAFQLHGDWR